MHANTCGHASWCNRASQAQAVRQHIHSKRPPVGHGLAASAWPEALCQRLLLCTIAVSAPPARCVSAGGCRHSKGAQSLAQGFGPGASCKFVANRWSLRGWWVHCRRGELRPSAHVPSREAWRPSPGPSKQAEQLGGHHVRMPATTWRWILLHIAWVDGVFR
jgi:hypothetical protein